MPRSRPKPKLADRLARLLPATRWVAPEVFFRWLEITQPTPQQLSRVINALWGSTAEDVAYELSGRLEHFTPGLVRAILRRDSYAVWPLAKNPHLRDPKCVRLVLDECQRRAWAYHPDAPFGVNPEWDHFKAVIHLLETGRVTFRHPGIRTVHRRFARFIEAPWARMIVIADPSTSPRVLERAYSKLEKATVSRLNEPRNEILEGLLLRNTKPELARERWFRLLDSNSDKAIKLLGQEHIRRALLNEDLVKLLQHESQEIRLAVISHVPEIIETYSSTRERPPSQHKVMRR